MTEFFHFAPLRLQPGSVIEPGNWGRIVKRYERAADNSTVVGNPWLLCRELVFETVRANVAATKPSRLNATFAVISMESAQKYRRLHDPKYLQVLHRVDLAAPDAPQHVGSLEMLDWPDPGPYLDQVREKALKYWRGEGGGYSEIVSAGPLQVLSIVD